MTLIHQSLTSLDGCSFALLLWVEGDDGEDDVALFSGTLRYKDGVLNMARADGRVIRMLPEWYEGIRPVSDPEIAAIVGGADYVLSLSVGNLPDSANPDSLEGLGLRWPSD